MKFYRGLYISISTRKNAIGSLVIITILSLSLVYLLLQFPLKSFHYPKCIWYDITGTYCPGCGTIRGISEILNGHILGLYYQNKLAYLLSPVLLYTYVNLFSKSIFSFQLPIIKLNQKETYLFLLIIILYWFCRNFINCLSPY